MARSEFRWMILDISTAPIPGVADFLVPAKDREPDANLRDPEKIAANKQEKYDKELTMAATQLDLAQITGAAMWTREKGLKIALTMGEQANEIKLLQALAKRIDQLDPSIITFNGLVFDLGLLMRRSLYLGVEMPVFNLDKFRTPHIDLYEILSMNGRTKSHTLQWYQKRLGYTDVKPLTGKQEGEMTPESSPEMWSALAASLRFDAIATQRLASWMKILPPDVSTEPVAPPPDPGV